VGVCLGVIEACEATGHLRHSVHMPNAQSREPVSCCRWPEDDWELVHQAQPAALPMISDASYMLWRLCIRRTWVGIEGRQRPE
jgi:hypothetical protein